MAQQREELLIGSSQSGWGLPQVCSSTLSPTISWPRITSSFILQSICEGSKNLYPFLHHCFFSSAHQLLTVWGSTKTGMHCKEMTLLRSFEQDAMRLWFHHPKDTSLFLLTCLESWLAFTLSILKLTITASHTHLRKSMYSPEPTITNTRTECAHHGLCWSVRKVCDNQLITREILFLLMNWYPSALRRLLGFLLALSVI